MVRFALGALLALAWSACRFDGAGIGADIDGASPGAADADVPDAGPQCEDECTEGELRACGEAPVTCPFGCDLSAPRCLELVPSNGADGGDLDGVTAGLSLDGDFFLSTDDGEIVDEQDSAVRGGGEGVVDGIRFEVLPMDIALLAVEDFSLAPGARLRVRGARPLLLLSAGQVTIEGEIDLSGGCSDPEDTECAGPGGGRGATVGQPAAGCAPGADGEGGAGASAPEAGGGGGGLGAPGADGGDADESTEGGAGGDPQATGDCPGEDLVPLRGGSGGGRGGGPVSSGGAGGGGGGALQITSLVSIACLGSDQDPADVWAGGAGGHVDTNSGGNGGGGGGAGGGILLEAPSIELTDCRIAANGGGGGDGTANSDTNFNGEYGRRDDQQAAGGDANGGNTRGGDGGALAGAPTEGAGPTDGAGGGGGGVGIIRLNSDQLSTQDSVISPAHTTGEIVIE